jgi:tRNA(Ile)-lysidine synthase
MPPMKTRRSFWARTWSKLARSRSIPDGARVLAAVSGGPDSVALAHWLWLRSKKSRLRLALAHVNHGIRGKDAKADEAFVRELGETWGVPIFIRRVDVPAAAKREGRSLEDAARKLRYRALAQLARKHGFPLVAVAQHADDQAETVLLHLLRGTDPKGLAGMPERRPLAEGVELVRPMLVLTRADVQAYLKFYGLRSRFDKSNRDLDRTRNWVRKKLLPLLEARSPNIRIRLVELARRVSAGT